VTRYGQGDVSREDPLAFDEWNPRNISPLVAWLSTEQCPVSGRTYWIKGGSICVLDSWDLVERLERPGAWTMDELAEHAQILGRGRPPHPDLVT
jgi:hypothetical protein